MKLSLRFTSVLLMSLVVPCTAATGALARGADLSQAYAMLALLENVATGPVEEEAITAVTSARGTDLVLRQMNLMRRVTMAQYAALLRSLHKPGAPRIAPVDESERADHGVVGLTENVWPVLRWGMKNTPLLRQRLEEIRGLDVLDTARATALAFLPRPVEISARVSIVMGGRAGAAALAGNEIYVDLLLLSYLDHIGHREYVPEIQLLDFVSHEVHHLGLGQVFLAHRGSLDLSESEKLAYSLLSSLVSEGSATYLISGHRDLERALADLGAVTDDLTAAEGLLRSCEHVLKSIVSGEINSREQLDESTGFLLGSGAHLAGTLMIARIDEHSGLDGVMAILADPRKLLLSYNRATGEGSEVAGQTLFDPELAAVVAALGEAPR